MTIRQPDLCDAQLKVVSSEDIVLLLPYPDGCISHSHSMQELDRIKKPGFICNTVAAEASKP